MGTGHLCGYQLICMCLWPSCAYKTKHQQIINSTLKITIFIEINNNILAEQKCPSPSKHRKIHCLEEGGIFWFPSFSFLVAYQDFMCPPLIEQTLRICSLLQPRTFIFLLEPFQSWAALYHEALYQQNQPWDSSPTLFERICFGKLVSLTKLMSAWYI